MFMMLGDWCGIGVGAADAHDAGVWCGMAMGWGQLMLAFGAEWPWGRGS